jgi:hypothetical protein
MHSIVPRTKPLRAKARPFYVQRSTPAVGRPRSHKDTIYTAKAIWAQPPFRIPRAYAVQNKMRMFREYKNGRDDNDQRTSLKRLTTHKHARHCQCRDREGVRLLYFFDRLLDGFGA